MLHNTLFNKRFGLTVLAAAIAVSLAGCGSDDDDNNTDSGDTTTDTFTFSSLALPSTAEEKASVRTSSEVTINDTTYSIGYMELYTSGQSMSLLGGSGTTTWGAWYDRNLNNFMLADGSLRLSDQSSGPDFTSLLTYQDSGNTLIFAVTQLESSIGGAYITLLSQDAATGQLTAVSTRPADTSGVFGMYVNCAGQVTPWGTHLGSEEYEPPMVALNPDASAYDTTPAWANQANMAWFDDESWHDEHMLGIAEFNGLDNTQIGERSSDTTGVGPETFGYYFGWTPEIAITSANGGHTVTKHYAMGRFAHELSYVMPDQKTVYMSDDGTNTGLFMFIADNEADLSAGTLYAAKWNQTSSADIGAADLTWVNLGHASNGQIEPALRETSATDEGIRFEDMFDKEAANEDGTCPSTDFSPVNAYDHGLVCVRLKDGDFDTNGDGTGDVSIATLASRLETRIYAGMQGATTEFRKEEGITFNAQDNVLYVAMSEVARGMENNSSVERDGSDRYDIGDYNDIRLDSANLCGGVYALDVVSGMSDTNGDAINSSLVASNMKGLVWGTPIGGATDDVCDANGLANPDNVTYLEGYRELVIGEDTGAGNHENNMVWSYDIDSNSLVRIATTPAGAETTSPFWHRNVNGWGYMSLVAQHPDDAHTSVGMIGPFPALD